LETVKEQARVTAVPALLCPTLTVAYCDKFSLKELSDDKAVFDNEALKFHSFYT